jgi:hypothetical protein
VKAAPVRVQPVVVHDDGGFRDIAGIMGREAPGGFPFFVNANGVTADDTGVNPRQWVSRGDQINISFRIFESWTIVYP